MNLEPQQIFQLVSLLAVLALFCVSLRGQLNYSRWFKQWESDRKARRDAEIAAETEHQGSGGDEAGRGGPWG